MTCLTRRARRNSIRAPFGFCNGISKRFRTTPLFQASFVFLAAAFVAVQSGSAQVTDVSATDGAFETRVVITWAADVPNGGLVKIVRIEPTVSDTTLLAVRSQFDTEYSDSSGEPAFVYNYCITTTDSGQNDLDTVCDDGSRIIFKPTGLRATDGLFEDRVLVSWADRSNVEARYELTRSEGGQPAVTIATLPENSGAYFDTTAVPGATYTYCTTAFDFRDFASDTVCDDGLRGFVTPPQNVAASDGQYPDFVRVTWTDFSDVETLFTVYRSEGAGAPDTLGTVPSDSTLFLDATAVTGVIYNYCVTATSGGEESVTICNDGVRGVLPSPENVVATIDDFDDRVVVSWTDATDTEDGFQIFRALPAAPDSVRLASVGQSVASYADVAAAQDQDYRYCVRAFSAVATPDTTYSPSVCATGRRTTVLAPRNVTATDDAFEERISITWSDPSTTAMLFNLYRDDVLIRSVSTLTPFFSDFEAPSNKDLTYCVTAVSVRGAIISAELASEMLETAEIEAALSQTAGSSESLASRVFASFKQHLNAVATVSLTAASQTIVETARVCDVGRRTLAAPSSVTATYEEFEDHVQLSWTDRANAERGYIIYRNESPIDSTSANRSSYGDYSGVPGVEYVYSVRAYDLRGPGGLSDPGTDTGMRRLLAPTSFIASDGTSEAFVELSWTDNSRAEDGYRIYRRSDTESVFTLIGSTNAGVVQFTNDLTTPLPDPQNGDIGVQYVYRIVAFDAYGESAAADNDGRTDILAPAEVNASKDYTGSVVVAWIDLSELETGYRVWRDGVLVATTAANATTYIDATASPDRTYEYCVSTTADGGAASALVCSRGGLVRSTVPLSFTGEELDEVLTASDGQQSDEFGYDAATSGDYAIIGAPGDDDKGAFAGSAYVFRRDGTSWTQQQKLSATDGAPDDNFGWSVSIDGDYAIVGAWGDDDRGSASGSAYIFKRDGTRWTQQQKLVAADGTAGDQFGSSVSIDGNYAIIGEPWGFGVDTFSGAAYVFERDGTSWTQQDKLVGTGVEFHDRFGAEVSIAGDYAIIGAEGEQEDPDTGEVFDKVGSAFVFKRNATGWTEQQRLFASDSTARDQFGSSVSIDGNYALVGAVGDDRKGTLTGSAYVFKRDGGFWTEQQKLIAPDGAEQDFFGSARSGVSIDGDYAIVGAWGDDDKGAYSGSAYLFRREEDSWVGIAKLLPGSTDGSAGDSPSTGAGFGQVAVAGGDVVIGASQSFDQGAVYVAKVLVKPTEVSASDGTFADRIQVRWTDNSLHEGGYRIYRREADGELKAVGVAGVDANSFDDFSAAAGNTFEYCIVASNAELKNNFGDALGESLPTCDIGWRPANGSLSGRVAALGGGGTEDVQVCLQPSPNRSLLFDGIGGYVSLPQVAKPDQMTLCAWVKTTQGGSVVAGTSTFAERVHLSVDADGFLSFEEGNGVDFKEVTSDVQVNTGRWEHVCVVRNVASAQLYVNGTQRGSDTAFVTASNGIIQTVGADVREGVVSPFAGQIDDLQIWGKAMTVDSIAALAGRPLGGSEPGLLSYWSMDEGTGGVTAELTGSGKNATLQGGVHWTDVGAVNICAVTDTEGNYSLVGLNYGESTRFTVKPSQGGRVFEPGFKSITLSTDNPVQNEVDFADNTAFTVAGVVQFEGTSCPVPDAEMYLTEIQNGTAGTRVFKGNTEVDGSYSIAVDPSKDSADLRRIEPQFGGPEDARIFTPARIDTVVQTDLFEVNFADRKTRTLTGYFGGSCEIPIGTAMLRIFTADGCFEREIPLAGRYSTSLPPQKYLVQVVEVNADNDQLRADIIEFFDELGAQEVDLSLEDDTLDFIYHAPLDVSFEGLPEPAAACTEGLTLADGNRTLPNVPIVIQDSALDLTIRLFEDYGNDRTCSDVNGKVTIFDAITNLPDPVTLEVQNGRARYLSRDPALDNDDPQGLASPNISVGRTIDGTDRSLQKSITAIAEVQGRPAKSVTEWVIVEGASPRTGTFVSASTEEMPMLILRDPPGSNSYSYREKGQTTCERWSNVRLVGAGGGVDFDLRLGGAISSGIGFGAFVITDQKAAISFRTRIVGGEDVTELDPGEKNLEVCATTTERWSTSDADTWVGEDLFAGVALNLLFAITDEITTNSQECSVQVAEKLAMDLDPTKAFETAYVFGETHIKESLIPALNNLIDLVEEGGEDAENKELIFLEGARETWDKHLLLNDSLITASLKKPGTKNRSFSAGADYAHTMASGTTTVTEQKTTRVYLDTEGGLGLIQEIFGIESWNGIAFEARREWVEEEESTENSSIDVGYVLSDGDKGDYFSVKVAIDSVYGTPVFQTVSGRSSNPWEDCGDRENPCTQRRDWPVLDIFPPVRREVPADALSSFTMTLENKSESKERREYLIAISKPDNPGSAFMSFTGDPIDGDLFTVEGGKSQEITLQVARGPNRYAYENLALIAYPEKEYEIWQADPRQPFAMSDTAFFSIFFEAPCSDISILRPKDPWVLNAVSIGDSLQVILSGFDLGGSDVFNVRSIGLQYRLVGSSDWLPAVAIPIGVKDTEAADSLASNASSWSTRWLPPREGSYEIRAVSECQNDKAFSDVVIGFVDTKPPRLLGNPEPSDEVLALGSEISATFNEPIDCESISTSGQFQNTELVFVTGPNSAASVDGIEAVCNGETIVIEPPEVFDWDAAEGQIMEARFLTNVKDAQDRSQVIKDLADNPLDGNVSDKIAWQFTVRRSAFTWSPANLTVEVNLGTSAEFEAQLVNGRTGLVEYALTGMPEWLTATPQNGTVAPSDGSSVSFLGSDTLAIGQYPATVLAENNGLSAVLNLTVDVGCPSPGWDFDQNTFSYSMDLTALLSMEGTSSIDSDDLLAAFVGDELRGTAAVDNAGLIRMTIYSPLPAGETVTFRALDASECRLYPATDLILTFANGTSEGDTGDPIAINALTEAPQQSVALSKGWSMFSINRIPNSTDPNEVLASVAPSNSDVLKSQTAFSLYDGSTKSWIGALADVVHGKAYMIRLSGPNSLIVSGSPVDPLTAPIELTPGWSWIGYHPQGSQSVDDALASLSNPNNSDLIKSQYGFAQWDGSNWIGSLQTMDPGLGYMIKRANEGTIVYPDVPAGPALRVTPNRPVVSDDALARLGKKGSMNEETENERANGVIDFSFKRPSQTDTRELQRGLRTLKRDYEHSAFNMTVTAEVQIDDQPANRPVFVGAFVAEEPRGLAQATYVESLDSYRVFLMIYSNEPEGETVTFRILDDETDRFYDLNQTAPFEADAILGTPGEPVVLDNRASGKLKTAEELPTQFALRQNYPNPFNPTTTIKYDVPSQSDVRIVLYDVLGREVRRLVDGNQKAGRYEVVFDASQIASGAYFYRMQAGDFQALHKMIVLK